MKSETPGEHVQETLENYLSYFINQWMNESINESCVSRTAHGPETSYLILSHF